MKFKRRFSVDKFWELMEKSVLVQATVTLALIGVTVYLWAMEKEVPVLLASTLSLVMGFWFGTKVQKIAHNKVG